MEDIYQQSQTRKLTHQHLKIEVALRIGVKNFFLKREHIMWSDYREINATLNCASLNNCSSKGFRDCDLFSLKAALRV